jgi:hypothetical protein
VLGLAGAPATWERHLSVALLASKGLAVASHRAAARVYRLDGFDRSALLELTVPEGRMHRSKGVIVHRTLRLDPLDTGVVDGLRLTTLPRTLVDLGSVVDDDALEAAVDSAFRRGLSEDTLRHALGRLARPGASGVGRMRRVLARPERAGALPETLFERLVDRVVRKGGLPPPRRQFEVRGEDGRVLGRIDLAWPEVRLGLEAHSDRWHYGPRRGRRDRRDNLLAAAGWELLYAGWSDARSESDFVELVSVVYRRRFTTPGLVRDRGR